MKTTQTLTAAAIAAALSLPFAGAALADTPAIDKTDTVMLAANTMDDAGTLPPIPDHHQGEVHAAG